MSAVGVAESRVTATPTQLTSLCGAEGQLVVFIAAASDQRKSERDRKKEEEREADVGLDFSRLSFIFPFLESTSGLSCTCSSL